MRECSKCKKSKSESDFYRKGRGLQSWCKNCANERARKHYIDNKKNKIDYANRRRRTQVQKNQQFIVDYLSTHPCIVCGESDIVVLEFDHRGEQIKHDHVSAMFRKSTERLKEEIEKCDVKCANCHRRKTARDNQSYRLFMQASVA